MKGWLINLNKEILITEDGLKKLEDELELLKTVKRKDIAEKIKVALSFGDLSENSEYDSAKNEQAQIESRIAELEATLKHVKVIDEDDIDTEIIRVGTKVSIKNMATKDVLEYQIVGSTESDPRNRKISDESPVGKELLGHKKGDKVEIVIPSGSVKFQVLNISK